MVLRAKYSISDNRQGGSGSTKLGSLTSHKIFDSDENLSLYFCPQTTRGKVDPILGSVPILALKYYTRAERLYPKGSIPDGKIVVTYSSLLLQRIYYSLKWF
jgi:hypothetical protein